MPAHAVRQERLVPSASTAPALAELTVLEVVSDAPLVSIPRPEVHIVVRFGVTARGGIDAHAMGGRQTVHRKVIRGGQRAITARLSLGAPERVLGAPAASIAGRIVELEELWGVPAVRRLLERLSAARGINEAAVILEGAIGERMASGGAGRAPSHVVLDAADRLARENVNAVADDLGVSERHLRRIFREATGVSPKTFAKLRRFHRALRAARSDARATWASIASGAGYYDQAHLIAEFRAIAGVTPRVLMGQMAAIPEVG